MPLILLVDDNEDNRAIYCTLLEHRGHVCLEAPDGASGVAMAQEHQPDLILLDIGMPVLDGWGAVARLKGDPATAEIPILALTAHVFAEDESRASAAGFAGFIRKPASPLSVAEAVESIVGPGSSPEAS